MLVPLGVSVKAQDHDPECVPAIATDTAPLEIPPAQVFEVRVTPSPASQPGAQACARPRLLVARADFGPPPGSRGRGWASQLSLGSRALVNRTFSQGCAPLPGRVAARPILALFAVADFAPEP